MQFRIQSNLCMFFYVWGEKRMGEVALLYLAEENKCGPVTNQ